MGRREGKVRNQSKRQRKREERKGNTIQTDRRQNHAEAEVYPKFIATT